MDLNTKVLVVDDFSTMRRIIRGTLKQMGFKNIIEAEDGNLALTELKNNNIGLILCDWNMPNLTGLDLLKVVRGDENLKNIPFIMITAEGQKKNILDAIKAGVSNYIVKPFTAEILIEKIKTVLG
ncbi:MAG: response regulator [Desulfobacterales bacterium]|nr:response regulator [Desulfobacterales bacterium]